MDIIYSAAYRAFRYIYDAEMFGGGVLEREGTVGNVGGGSGTVRYFLPTYARKYISYILFFMYDLCRLKIWFGQ